MDDDRVQIAVGSRFAAGATTERFGAHRGLISRTMIGLAHLLLGGALPPLSDPMSGMFAVRRQCVDLAALAPRGYKILLEVVVRSRLAGVRDVPIQFGARSAGTSKLTLRIGLIYLVQLVCLCWARGRWWLFPLTAALAAAVVWLVAVRP
ncbi:MAG: hypothetical protein HY815_30375 [Candidatus Riflebacteria bacterium]|nr:hypothetical protein [Candidatus Riflebacteria bacterium]